MRIPLISRIDIKLATLFAVVLFVAQMLEGTDFGFASLTAGFILLSTIAFNTAGGLPYPSGWYVFFNALLTCILGLTVKAVLGQPGQTHLDAPNLTMLAYCGGMFVTALTLALVRRLRPKAGLLSGMSVGESMRKAAIGSFLLGLGINVLTITSHEQGSLGSALSQINVFGPLAILLATFYEVRKTNGRSSSNWIVWAASVYGFVLGGVLGFSKQGFFTPPVTWLVAAVAAGHNFTRKQILGILFFVFVAQTVLIPYSQVGRNLRPIDPTIADDLRAMEQMLGDFGSVRESYRQQQLAVVDERQVHLFDSNEGFLDRLNMLSPDDDLIAYTARGNVEGTLPTYEAFLNIIPHFLWKDKPFYYIGNDYAREIGMIDEDNTVTGVSFSPVGDAYHQAEWFGVFLILPFIVFIFCIIVDSLSGDIRRAPWGMLFCVAITHTAPEGMLGGQIYVATYSSFGIVVAALLAKHVLPIVTGVITNSERTRVVKTVDFRPANPLHRNPGAESI